jgi:hypothetical protein
MMVDPIFATIDARKQAMKIFEAVRCAPDDGAPADVVHALVDAGCAMLCTVPTTISALSDNNAAAHSVHLIGFRRSCGEVLLLLGPVG